MTACKNCGSPGALHRSYDLDLPLLVLCGACSILLVVNPDLYEEVGHRHRRTGKPMLWPRQPPAITCPHCKRTSHNPNDVKERYCGVCGYHDLPAHPPPAGPPAG